MGNRGMTNWKLGAFFIVSLMLIAAVFSNTAMAAANDGKGEEQVEWIVMMRAISPTHNPLPAASESNVLAFTYNSEASTVAAADVLNMAGGAVQIEIATGWTWTGKWLMWS